MKDTQGNHSTCQPEANTGTGSQAQKPLHHLNSIHLNRALGQTSTTAFQHKVK